MAAGLGFKTFTTGEVLTAADTNGYLMQGVLVFASAAARDAAITSPQEGQCCYLKDTDAVLTYSGAAWVGFDDSNAIQNAIVDAKGDLITATAADTPARLAVGTNGQTLVADSTASTGLKWATPASGGGMTLLSTTSLTGAATITISSISQSYTNLYILITGLTVTTGAYTLKLRPGASNANNYSNIAGATVASSNPDYISPGNAGHSSSSAVNDYALILYNYTDAAARKPFHLVGIAKMTSQVEPLGVSALGATNVTAAISSFELNNDSGGNFTAGTVKIYGVN